MSYNLSEELYNYLEISLPNVLPLVAQGFQHLADYGALDSDVKYLDIIYSEEIDPSEKSELVLDRLRGSLCEIVTMHGITLTENEIPQLSTLNKLVAGFTTIQQLEDNSFIIRILEGELSNREMFNEIMIHHCNFELVEILDIVNDVDDVLIEELRKYVEEEITDEVIGVQIDTALTTAFFEFTKSENSIGKNLYIRGYNNFTTFEELLKVLPFELSDRLKESVEESSARAALDLLSVMMITRDARDTPMEFFKEYSEILFTDVSLIDDIYVAFMAISNHFTNYNKVTRGLNK